MFEFIWLHGTVHCSFITQVVQIDKSLTCSCGTVPMHSMRFRTVNDAAQSNDYATACSEQIGHGASGYFGIFHFGLFSSIVRVIAL